MITLQFREVLQRESDYVGVVSSYTFIFVRLNVKQKVRKGEGERKRELIDIIMYTHLTDEIVLIDCCSLTQSHLMYPKRFCCHCI